MLHKLAPTCTLYVKVTVKQRPYSQEPVSISVIAAMHPNVTVNNLQYFSELPLQYTTLAKVQSTILSMQTRANAANVSFKISRKVFQYIAQPTQ